MPELATIKFSEGLIEAWMEQEVEKGNRSAAAVLEHFKVFAVAFDETRLQLLVAAAKLAKIQEALAP